MSRLRRWYLRHWFYVGDGQYGLWRWLWARWLWRWLPWALAPRLPRGVQWNVSKGDERRLYARRERW